jgi:hypothetical protein
MASVETLRHTAALKNHKHAVCKHAKWVQEVRADVAFNEMKFDIDTIDLYERHKLEILYTNIMIEHCKAMILIRGNPVGV